MSSKERIESAFNEGFDGVQLGTQIAVTKETLNNTDYGARMKENMIIGNHLGKKTSEDLKYEDKLKNIHKTVRRYINFRKRKVASILKKEIEETQNITELKLNERLLFVIDFIEKEIF